MDRVWPPTLVGKRKASFTDPYVHDSDADVKLILPSWRYITGHQDAGVRLKEITVKSVKCDWCPVYVFPTSAEAFISAVPVDHGREEILMRANFPKLSVGWTLKYATVEDMARIDPHRKLVDWIAIHTSKEFNNDVPIRTLIGTPQCLSAIQKEVLQAKLRDMCDAENVKGMNIVESEGFATWRWTSVLVQDELKSLIQSFLKEMTFLGTYMTKAFSIDGVRVAHESFERLNSLGVLMGNEHERATNAFTSSLIHRGIELELETLQKTTDEIRRVSATKRLLELDHLDSTEVLVMKQKKEMIQHLNKCAEKSRMLMEEAMMSRVTLVTSLRQTEKKASALQKFISSGATEFVEEAYSDALKKKDQELIEKVKSSQECCICYHGLEGFLVGTSCKQPGEKLHKRACFLPCMHANVCITCSEKRWNEGPKKCPICRQRLTKRPRVIYL